MTTNSPRPIELDATTLDRLVDGELTSAERRVVLEILEQQPAHWRRLAIAFLEAQEWQASLRGTALASQPQSAMAVDRHLDQSSVSGGRANGWYLAIAASVLFAFGLGFAINRQLNVPHTTTSIASEVEPQPVTPQLAQQLPSNQNIGHFDPAEIEALLGRMGHRVLRRRGYVPVTFDDGRQVNLPMREVEVVPIEYRTY